MNRFVRILLLALSLLGSGGVVEAVNYSNLFNIPVDTDAYQANCFAQDPTGFVWIGTNKGLCRYDGYSITPCFLTGGEGNFQINDILLYKERYLLLGTAEGMRVHDIFTGKYLDYMVGPGCMVRSLCTDGNVLLLGTDLGLWSFRLDRVVSDKTVPPADDLRGRLVLGSASIYSIVRLKDSFFAGTMRGLYSYTSGAEEAVHVPLTGRRSFLNCIFADEANNCIWYTSDGLHRYQVFSGETSLVSNIPAAKTMVRDIDGRLVVGTDTGLYVFDPSDGGTQSFLHDPYTSHSLSDNVVRSLYRDAEGNIWIGTDYGISMAQVKMPYTDFGIADLSDERVGNVFYAINRDYSGNLWMGGNNGILRIPDGGATSDTEWFRLESGLDQDSRGITHNRIRDIMIDSKGRVFAATDGGLKLYDAASRRFDSFQIRTLEDGHVSNWIYRIIEDREGYYWVSTYRDGIFKLPPGAFGQGRNVVSERSFDVNGRLSDNHVDEMAYNGVSHSIYAIVGGDRIDRIDCSNGVIDHIGFDERLGRPVKVVSDSDEHVWVAFSDGVMKVDTISGEVRQTFFGGDARFSIQCMAKVGRYLWICTSSGILFISESGNIGGGVSLGDRLFLSIFYSQPEGMVYLGRSDGYIVVDDSITEPGSHSGNICVSRIFVDGSEYESPHGKPAWLLNEVVLKSRQSNITVELANLSFSDARTDLISYSVGKKGGEVLLESGTNRISLNLKPGNYELVYARRGVFADGREGRLSIRIRRPFFLSIFAIICYILLLGALLANFIRMISLSKRLESEQREKELVLRQVKDKMAFYSGISHEFKTPLSMILAPVSQMLSEPHSPKDRKNLEIIRDYALKMNQLIHRTIEHDREGDTAQDTLIRTPVEIVGFTRTIFTMFENNNRDSGKEFTFVSSVGKLWYSIDVVKFESIINNLLSNACKFTSGGDSIIVSIFQVPGAVEIKVSDTGLGIPEDKLPYIFLRFFTSSDELHGSEGSGIGLYLVKKYLDSHGGSISVDSNEGKGSTFTVSLPDEYVIKDAPAVEETLADDREGLPAIVIVEDNEAIATFLKDLFSEEYRCLIAHNGKTGLALCQNVLPDLVITDIMMPVMDGIQMCMEIKSKASTSRIPIIVLTAVEDKQYELFSVQHDIDAFFSKPFDAGIIKAKAMALIDKKKEVEKQIRIEVMSAPRKIDALSQDEKLVARIVKEVEDRLTDPEFNVSSLCETLGVSNKYLYRKCTQLLNHTPVDYIRMVRLKKAAYLLEQHKFNVSEVMYMVGFSNLSYFSKCFQKEFGMTPLQYRKEHEGNPTVI